MNSIGETGRIGKNVEEKVQRVEGREGCLREGAESGR